MTQACSLPFWKQESIKRDRYRNTNHTIKKIICDFPGGASGKESACQCRRRKRCGFDPWVRKIPWKRKCQPTPGFLPENFHEQEKPEVLQSMGTRRVTTERWSDWAHTLQNGGGKHSIPRCSHNERLCKWPNNYLQNSHSLWIPSLWFLLSLHPPWIKISTLPP